MAYRRYGRQTTTMPNNPGLLSGESCEYVILFDISGSMSGINAKIACSLLNSLKQLLGDTAIVSPFGTQEKLRDYYNGDYIEEPNPKHIDVVMTLSEACDYFPKHNYNTNTYPDIIIKRMQQLKGKKFIIITDGELSNRETGVECVAKAIKQSPAAIFFTNYAQSTFTTSTVESWKGVFTGQIVHGSLGFMLDVVPKIFTYEETIPRLEKMMFLMDNYVSSTDTHINLGQVSLERTMSMNQMRQVLTGMTQDQLQIAGDLILFAMEAIRNTAAQQLINAPWFLNVLQAFKKTPKSNFESMLDKFLTDNPQLSGIQAIFRKLREQLQYEEMMETFYPSLQADPNLWTFIESLKTSLPRLSGINFSDNSGSWFRTLVEHLPEYAPVNISTNQMINFFRILPTMYGMKNALSEWYAKCLIVQCVVQRKMRNWIENCHEIISQITPEYINTHFFDSVTGEIQPWVCAPSMMPVVFQLAKHHFDTIPILDKLIRTWISYRMIQVAKNHQFESHEFSLNNQVKADEWGFWAVLKSHGESDPCAQFPSIVFVRWSPTQKKFVAHYFEQPEPQTFRHDIYSTGEESMWDAIDKRFLFDGETPKYFLKVDNFRTNTPQIMEDMTNLLRPLWLEVSQREQPDGPYHEAPDYTMVLGHAVELIEAYPDTVCECPIFTFTDIDKITELVAKMNGIPSHLAHQIKKRWDGTQVRNGIQTDFTEPQETPEDYFLNAYYDQVVMRLETPYQIGERREQHPIEVDNSFECPCCFETITSPQQNVPHDPRHAVCDTCISQITTVAFESGNSVLCPICRHILEEAPESDSESDDDW
jgi:hypothetical protein